MGFTSPHYTGETVMNSYDTRTIRRTEGKRVYNGPMVVVYVVIRGQGTLYLHHTNGMVGLRSLATRYEEDWALAYCAQRNAAYGTDPNPPMVWYAS